MSKTLITLYRCKECNRDIYETDIAAGNRCKCGSNKVMLASPTLWRMVKFFWRHPGYIKVMVRENVLNRA